MHRPPVLRGQQVPLRPVGKSARYYCASAERRHMRYAGITCRRPAAGRTAPGGGPAWTAGGLVRVGHRGGQRLPSRGRPTSRPREGSYSTFPASARRRPTHMGRPSLLRSPITRRACGRCRHSIASWSSRWIMVQRRRPLWAFAGTINGPRWKYFLRARPLAR